MAGYGGAGAPPNTRGQDAWLMNATVRDNVAFFRPRDDALYHLAVEVCQLGPDLDEFPDGDATEIGERGTNISGGQKQRVSCMEQCICGVLRGRTVVLVTHQTQYLHRADEVVVIGRDADGLRAQQHRLQHDVVLRVTKAAWDDDGDGRVRAAMRGAEVVSVVPERAA
eukprot:gene30686-65347_t